MKMNNHVSSDCRTRNVNFALLVDDLENKLRIQQTSQLKHQLLKAKSEWLDQQIVYIAVQNVLENIQQKIVNGEVQDQTAKCWGAIQDSLCINECHVYMTDTEETSLLGLNHSILDDLDQRHQKLLNKAKGLLQEEVQQHLEAACVTITKLHDGPSTSGNSKVLQARSVQMGEIVQKGKANLVEDDNVLKKVQKDQADLCMQYHQELQQCCDVLTKLLKKYRLHLQPRKDQILLKHALVSCETFNAKLRSIRMKLKCETYDAEAIDALRKLRSEITTTIRLRERESVNTHHQLVQYRDLGSDFEAVVKEYVAASSDLEKQEWTLNEIKKKMAKA